VWEETLRRKMREELFVGEQLRKALPDRAIGSLVEKDCFHDGMVLAPQRVELVL